MDFLSDDCRDAGGRLRREQVIDDCRDAGGRLRREQVIERNTSVSFRVKKIHCGSNKQARSWRSGEKCGLTDWLRESKWAFVELDQKRTAETID
jgi:hypothetical protein